MNAMLIGHDTDEVAVLSLVARRAGMTVTAARNLDEALNAWSNLPADLIVTALAADDPPLVVRTIRRLTVVPLVVVTERCPEQVHAETLRAGADLVVFRPFSARLLIAQVEALLRRGSSLAFGSAPTLRIGDLSLDTAKRTVTVRDRPARHLTHLEFRLLHILMIHRDQVLPTEIIVERVWGYTGEGDRDLLRGLVSRLRAKVEIDPRDPQFIKTVPGLGYSFGSDEAS